MTSPRRVAVVLLSLWVVACRSNPGEDDTAPGDSASRPTNGSASPAPAPPPQLLYLPDGGDQVQNQGRLEPLNGLLPGAPPVPGGRCPPEMVAVRGLFCIDRYEASLVDARERALSPYYPPAYDELLHVLTAFRHVPARGRAAPALPLPPEYSTLERFEAQARSVAAVTPNGYMSGAMARAACERAGKRLCTPEEWVTACKGERATKFPYGDSYVDGACNVFREAHPAVLLHGDASKNHLDPRLNLVEADGGPLLRKTGATPRCRSDWGQDAIFDMVGNLDEWVDEPSGAFQGGFFSRATREGCDARISVHPPQYFDYSLGVRCCL